MKLTSILSATTLTFLVLPAAMAQSGAHSGAQSGTTKPAAKPAAPAAQTASAPAAEPSAIILVQKPAYPLTTCVACGKPLPATPIDHVKNGRLYRLDAEACAKAVDADPAGMAKKIELAVISQQKSTYPLKTSPVSDKPLDDKAVDHVYGTRLVRLASSDEVATFEKNPAPAMAKVDKALIASLVASYPEKTCPVSKEELGGANGDPVDYLYGTHLVRFCCTKCLAKFEKSPETYLKGMTAAK